MHEQIGAKLYDNINSRENSSISDIESMKICRDDEINDYDKVNIYCNTFNKYMNCMKEIGPSFLSTVLKKLYQTSIYAQY